ncbi:deoxycytidylate deaminase, putative [Eimeria necatrix]|uniref:dCMP deaminase n=1 Tax=Eimeria necatrix TaxID=51315 RepID=U6MFM7_9EIME|nr:deoxycytidylate deaminase, putative [Eimeria necatrix]CDJ62836.1 deoxycytidylate deaminase, putative [Eimeria necatrix]
MVVVGIVGPQKSGKKAAAAILREVHGSSIVELASFANREVKSGSKNGQVRGLKRGLCSEMIEEDGQEEEEEAASPKTAEAAAAVAAVEYCTYSWPAADSYFGGCRGPSFTSLPSARSMQHWDSSFVVLGFETLEQVKIFRKRPIFVLLAVDAPILTRLERAAATDVSAFLAQEDKLMFGTDTEKAGNGIYACMRQADAIVLGDGDLWSLKQKLLRLDLANPDRHRPCWDAYFIRLASLAASRANCLKRRVGAIVVRSNRLVSTGYNGTHSGARNCLEGGCRRCRDSEVHAGRQLEACCCIHAEANALLEAGRERCLGGTLYVTCLPCLSCAKLTIQAGIDCVVYAESYDAKSGSLDLLSDAGLEVYRFADRYPSTPHTIAAYAD